jgi:transcriptional regulator GlxA family with amidase domain
MHITLLLFDRITALDVIGPYEVLSRLPGARVQFVGPREGLVRTDQGLGLCADARLADVTATDVLVVPGGPGVDALVQDRGLLEQLRALHATTTWTTSVCTGSLVLGAAGLLEGLEATTHWAQLERLSGYGARPVQRRVVVQGKIVTAAGVSAGIDMALELAARIAGPEVAQAIQLGIEYDPAPPFDAGSPSKAPAHLVELLRKLSAAAREPRAAAKRVDL